MENEQMIENIQIEKSNTASISSMTIKCLRKELENYNFQMKQLEKRIYDIENAIKNLKNNDV